MGEDFQMGVITPLKKFCLYKWWNFCSRLSFKKSSKEKCLGLLKIPLTLVSETREVTTYAVGFVTI